MKKYKFFLILLIFNISGAAYCGEPGLIIKSIAKSEFMGLGGTETYTTMYQTSNFCRKAETMKTSGIAGMFPDETIGRFGDITITDSETGIIYTLDTALKTYTEIRADSVMKSLEDNDSSTAKYNIFMTGEEKQKEANQRNIKWNTKIDSSTSIDTINGFPCRKFTYITTEENDTSGTEFVSQVWYYSTGEVGDILSKSNATIFGLSDQLMNSNSIKSNPIFGAFMEQFKHMQQEYEKGLFAIKSIYEIRTINSILDSIPTEDALDNMADALREEDSSMSEETMEGLRGYYEYLENLSKSSDKEYISMIKITSEITKFTPAELSDTLFQIPENYTRVESF